VADQGPVLAIDCNKNEFTSKCFCAIARVVLLSSRFMLLCMTKELKPSSHVWVGFNSLLRVQNFLHYHKNSCSAVDAFMRSISGNMGHAIVVTPLHGVLHVAEE